MDHSSSSTSAAAGRRRQGPRRGVSWCCAFNVPPSSPEILKASQRTHLPHPHTKTLLHRTSNGNGKPDKPRDSFSKLSSANSVPESPQSSKSSLSIVGRIDPRRILSPGRVSPIDSDPTHEPDAAPDLHTSSRSASFRALAERISMTHLHAESFRAAAESPGRVVLQNPDPPVTETGPSENAHNMFDVRLNLRSKRGGCMVLELNSEILCTNSELFTGLVARYKKGFSGPGGDGGPSSSVCRIEVPDVENLGIFRETIELMFEDDIAKRLLKIGVYRCIDILEVSAGIGFTRGVMSCLKYIEAVPWTEEEEEKLRSVFTRLKFDESTVKDIMARLYIVDAVNPQQNLARRLVSSITSTCTDANARNELKSLVKGLLAKSSVYEKDHCDVNKEEIYSICHSCISSLVSIFEEAISGEKYSKNAKPLIERISREVDNINWLLEILLDRQMGEEFVEIWMGQARLIELHGVSSPMVRYELSRVSAVLFIAMGTRRVQCVSQARSGLFQEWFMPMISDFGWLQRCRKGLEMKVLEDSIGQVLLTLPLKQQYALFMEWFRCFSKQGSECPNLSKAFQIWWRRSFLKGSESNAVEFR